MVASPARAAAVASSRQRMPSSTSAEATSAPPSSASPSISRSATSNRRPSSATCRARARTPCRGRPRRARGIPRGTRATRARAPAPADPAGGARGEASRSPPPRLRGSRADRPRATWPSARRSPHLPARGTGGRRARAPRTRPRRRRATRRPSSALRRPRVSPRRPAPLRSAPSQRSSDLLRAAPSRPRGEGTRLAWVPSPRSSLASPAPRSLDDVAVRVAALDADVAGLVPALDDLDAVGPESGFECADHSRALQSAKLEVEEGGQRDGLVRLAEREREPSRVREQEHSVLGHARRAGVEAEVRLVEATRARLVVHGKREVRHVAESRTR